MKRIDEDIIQITQQEFDNLFFFIRESLRREWDDHTNHFICKDSDEDGMRRMNPEMYDMAQQMISL